MGDNVNELRIKELEAQVDRLNAEAGAAASAHAATVRSLKGKVVEQHDAAQTHRAKLHELCGRFHLPTVVSFLEGTQIPELPKE